MQILDLVSIRALWNDYIRNSLWISPNFTRGSEMWSILSGVSETINRKWIFDFRGVPIRIFAVYHTSEPCKNGWTDRFAVWVGDSREPKEAQVQSYCIFVVRMCKNSWKDLQKGSMNFFYFLSFLLRMSVLHFYLHRECTIGWRKHYFTSCLSQVWAALVISSVVKLPVIYVGGKLPVTYR